MATTYDTLRSACTEARGGRITARAGAKATPSNAPRQAKAMTNRHFASGGTVEGGKPKHRADRKGAGHVSVNVVVPSAPPQAMPIPVPGRPGIPPVGLGAARPPMPMAGGPPPGGAAPMMRPPGMKRGGGVEDPPAGKKPPAMEGGAGGGLGRLEKSRAA